MVRLTASAAGLALILFGVSVGTSLDQSLTPALSAGETIEVPTELQAAESMYRKAGAEAALADFMQLQTEYMDEGQIHSAAVAQRFVGEIHWRLGNFEESEQNLLDALETMDGFGDAMQQAKISNVLGLLYWELGNYENALSHFSNAADRSEETDDPRMQGAILNNTSLVYDELGEYRRSLDTYDAALAAYDGVDFPRGEGDTLGNIGGVYLLLGQYSKALKYYEKALEISQGLQSVISMSQDHGNIALCYLGLGDASTALDHFNRAIVLAEQSGSKQDVAYWTRGKANALMRLGRFDRGLEGHREAVEVYLAIEAKTEAVEAMHDLGHIHLSLGDPVSAGQWFGRSMALARETGLARGITMNLLALGDLQLRREALEEAAALYTQGWQRARESGEIWLQADSLLRLAETHRLQKNFAQGVKEASHALELADEIDSAHLAAGAYYQLGEMKRLQSDPAGAAADFNRALQSLPEPKSPGPAWRIHYGLGLALEEQGEISASIANLVESIRHIESVRDRLAEQRFRAGFVQDKYHVYVDLVRIQMQAGKAEDAFSTAERLRSKSYADLIDTEFAVDSSSSEAQREAELKERIRQLRKVLDEEREHPGGEQRQPALQIYSEELIAAEQAYRSMIDDRQRSRSRRGDAEQTPGYDQVRQTLQPGEALVEYVVADQLVMIFVLTHDDLVALSTDLARKDLHSKVELLRDLIRRPNSKRWQRPATSLSHSLIDPLIKSGALEGITDLYLVPHGSLNYLPFALLPTATKAQRLLVEDYTLTYLPTAAALLQESSRTRADETLLAMAPARSGLRFAEHEANTVYELFRQPSRLVLGEAATESLFKQYAGDYSMLHLATHGYFNKLNPLLSGLELEEDSVNDGLLELHEIIGMDLHADLVTLSACQTGLGSGHFAEIPPGDDFVGLTRAFLYAGSDSVMATLWEVDDQSTAELMQQFYSQLRQSPEAAGKAAALTAAQRAFRSSKNYNHPYYWAPFVLMGASDLRDTGGTGSTGV
jgi:CHAT domain-containing protein/Tfp pilus assembly protein PilF